MVFEALKPSKTGLRGTIGSWEFLFNGTIEGCVMGHGIGPYLGLNVI